MFCLDTAVLNWEKSDVSSQTVVPLFQTSKMSNKNKQCSHFPQLLHVDISSVVLKTADRSSPWPQALARSEIQSSPHRSIVSTPYWSGHWCWIWPPCFQPCVDQCLIHKILFMPTPRGPSRLGQSQNKQESLKGLLCCCFFKVFHKWLCKAWTDSYMWSI